MRYYIYSTNKAINILLITNTKMKVYENYFYEEKINEDLFTTLLKKEIWLEHIFLNAIYLKNSVASLHGSYYIYYYSKPNNTCYINDLNFYGSTERLSVTNTIEHLSTRILPHIKFEQSKILHQKFQIPKFVYFHHRWYGSKEIIRQTVTLKPLYDEDNNLEWFSQPDWRWWNIIIKPAKEKVQ